jgi:hypothetical protein
MGDVAMTRSELSLARIQALAESLSDRDRLVLDTVSRVRIATASQLERLHFTDVGARERRRVLASLVEKKLLFRLPRTIGGTRAGSKGFVYALGTTGQRLRWNRTTTGRSKRPWTPGTTFLRHAVAVTEVYTRLVEAETRGELRLRRFETEPTSWRQFTGPGGARLVLRPDAYIELGINGHRDLWFLEVDLATESSSTLHRKCELYRQYWRTGKEESAVGAVPLVLFAVPTEARKGTLIDVLGRQPSDSWPLFTLCLLDGAVEKLRRGAGS